MKWLLATLLAVFLISCSRPSTEITESTIPSQQEEVALAFTGGETPDQPLGMILDLPDPETLATVARGRIVIEAPERMPVEKSETIIVEIQREAIEITQGENEVVLPTAAGLRLKLRLAGDDNVNIEPLTEETQVLTELGARWAWKIDPGDPGTHEIILIASLGRGETFMTLDVFEQELSVKDTWGHRWDQVDVQVLVGAALAISGILATWYKIIRPRTQNRGLSEDAGDVDDD